MTRSCKQKELWWWIAYYKWLRNKVFFISTIQGLFAWYVSQPIKTYFKNLFK